MRLLEFSRVFKVEYNTPRYCQVFQDGQGIQQERSNTNNCFGF